MDKPVYTTLIKWTKLKPPTTEYTDLWTPDTMQGRQHETLLLCQKRTSQLNHEPTSHKPKPKDLLRNNESGCFRSVKVRRDQESKRNWDRLAEAEETEERITTSSSGLNPGPEKRHERESLKQEVRRSWQHPVSAACLGLLILVWFCKMLTWAQAGRT